MSRKYLVLLIDGMADFKIKELGNKTPLEKADTPAMDKIKPSAEGGLAKTVPAGYSPGSDVANMSVLGYAPEKYYTGRSSIEALSMGVKLNEDDVSFRCNLVTLSDHKIFSKKIMEDYSAGEITSSEAEELITACNQNLGNDEFSFYPGVSYRNLLVWNKGQKELELTPPHDISDQKIGDYLPQGKGSKQLLKLIKNSGSFLNNHQVNQKRINNNLAPANYIWLWGAGTKMQLDDFYEKYNKSGSVISAVDLVKGLGIAAGLEVVNVPGATGRIDTNFSGKAEAALNCFEQGKDFVYLHVEAADEAGHQGKAQTKVKAIEKVDQLILQPILNELDNNNELGVLILPDHYTPVSLKTHIDDPVPFLMYKNYITPKEEYKINVFSEEGVQESELLIEQGSQLMDYFIDY